MAIVAAPTGKSTIAIPCVRFGANGCRLAIGLVLALLPAWFSPALADEPRLRQQSSVNDQDQVAFFIINGNVSGTGRIPESRKMNFFIVPETSSLWSATPRIDVLRERHPLKPQPGGKVMVAAGIGRNILAVSAEMYDSSSQQWLTNGQVTAGRWKRSLTAPFRGRMLVWGGFVVSF